MHGGVIMQHEFFAGQELNDLSTRKQHRLKLYV